VQTKTKVTQRMHTLYTANIFFPCLHGTAVHKLSCHSVRIDRGPGSLQKITRKDQHLLKNHRAFLVKKLLRS